MRSTTEIDPSQTDFFEFLGQGASDADTTVLSIASHLALSAALGAAVSGFYLFNTRTRPRTPGLAGTLVLLSMLIALVTLAIGNNAAKAFTLVGTLAIVRFRTPVRDIRDTAFVIFAVGVGISIGAYNVVAAIVGTAMVGLATVVLSRLRPADAVTILPVEGNGRLAVRFDDDGAPLEHVESLLTAHCRHFRLLDYRDGFDGGRRVTYVVDADAARATALTDAVRKLKGVRRASIDFGDTEDDDP